MKNPECQRPDKCQIDRLIYSKVGIGEVIALCQDHLNYYNYLKANSYPMNRILEQEIADQLNQVREEMRNELHM